MNSKGKLFGKISIIDILIVVVVVGAIAGVGYKFTQSKITNPFTKLDDIQIQFYAEDVPDYTANSIKVGDLVSDPVKNIDYGTVKDIKIGKSVSWGVDDKGEYVASSRAGYASIYITAVGKGIYNKDGVTFGGSEYPIGRSLEIRVGITAFWTKISDIVKKR